MNTERYNIQLPTELQAEAKKLAKEHGYTFSGFVADAIRHKIRYLKTEFVDVNTKDVK